MSTISTILLVPSPAHREALLAVVERHSDRSGGPDACWNATCFRNADGYGVVGVPGQRRTESLHRVSWKAHFGPIPQGQMVLHHCDNPPCCNPAHLFLGTHADNMRDMAEKGRGRSGGHKSFGDASGARKYPERMGRFGEINGSAKLTAAAIGHIRAAVAAGESRGSVAQRFGVHRSTIGRIIAGQKWDHVEAM